MASDPIYREMRSWFGVRIELEPRGAVVLALKKLDKLYASLVEIPDTAVRAAPRILSFSPAYTGLIEQITFSLRPSPRVLKFK